MEGRSLEDTTGAGAMLCKTGHKRVWEHTYQTELLEHKSTGELRENKNKFQNTISNQLVLYPANLIIH